jgi:hypothetical protein
MLGKNGKTVDMEKEFVSYELAIKLEELGFDEPCCGFYDHMIKEIDTISADACERLCKHHTHIKAPLFQQAFRWFRDEHELHYDITLSTDSSDQLIGYYILIHKLDGMLVNESNAIELDHNTPNREEAELACLDKLIEIVEQKEK